MTRSILADAFEHNVWATIVLIEVCEGLSAEQLEAAVPGTYGSILSTLRHTVGADAGYLFALTDGAFLEVDEASMDLAELKAVMERNGPAWAALLATNLDPDRDCVRHRDDGTESHAPVGVRLAQVVHHGTDHRSQICTALTSLGVEPPEIDVWSYAWTDRRIWEEPSPPSGA